MVLEYCGGGELYEYVNKVGTINELDCREIMEQVCSAMAYVHNKDIIHRDLKLENVLFKRGKGDLTVKVVDFGIAGNAKPS